MQAGVLGGSEAGIEPPVPPPAAGWFQSPVGQPPGTEGQSVVEGQSSGAVGGGTHDAVHSGEQTSIEYTGETT